MQCELLIKGEHWEIKELLSRPQVADLSAYRIRVIPAVKVLRQRFGLTLKEAKEITDVMVDQSKI